MVTESPLALLSEMAMRNGELDLLRSGSAPPSLDRNGNFIQSGAQIATEDLRSEPLYHSYYYSNVNLNPRLPPPLLPREDWRSAHQLSNRGSLSAVGGGVSNGRRLHQDGDFEGNTAGFGGIFQDPFSYPNPSPAAGLNANINDANHSTSSNGSSLSASNKYGSILSSPLSRSGSPDPEISMRVPSPGLGPIAPIGPRLNPTDRRMTTNGSSTFGNGSAGMDRTDKLLISALSNLNIQSGADTCHSPYTGLSFADQGNISRSYRELNRDNNTGHSPISRNFPNLLDNPYTGMNMNVNNGMQGLLNRPGDVSPNSFQMSLDPYNYFGNNARMGQYGGYSDEQFVDLLRLQQKKQQQQQPYGYFGDLGFGPGYMSDPVFPPSPTDSLIRLGEQGLMRCPSNLRKYSGFCNVGSHIHTLLEEFKNNKTRCYELSEIAGHVVEFSSDQYGSRFIQQKLETATSAEKDMVFVEIMPHAFTLMTDVFGNYVVQKFFEHGSAHQIKELANTLKGRVLQLSLQMYGCRVIQKAIEVVGLEQQTEMVAELAGNEMRCVRDQNGNHVIQKCIECVPQDVIHFLISTFYGQVLMLSTHAYGCRVIQRVLEHCDNPNTQQIMMEEILQNVNMLSQDQYGNYVVQHVLEHGKANERSAIIEKLAGQIVIMSRQKYASNVVEKCLAFCTPLERQILIHEMLGPTEENEALQEMMKDQFGNYVVQKVLETCSDQQRETILTRIRIHFTALKKYTYGKHIVARVEKLLAAGERRLAIQSGAYAASA